MKILHINISDVHGGATRAACRIHYGLRSHGVDSKLLVQEHAGGDPEIIGPGSIIKKQIARVRPYIDPLILRCFHGGSRTIFSPAWLPFSDVLNQVTRLNPDIVHLHWVCGGVLRPSDISLFNKPVVWTMHDMWPFTGGCHYSEGCNGYFENCGDCPQLYRSGKQDISYAVHNQKQREWCSADITGVAPSHWLADCARNSSLFGDKRIEVIPNCLDIDQFKPIDRKYAREKLNQSAGKKLVLFGSINATSAHRKGFDLLYQSIIRLKDSIKEDVELIVFGGDEPANPPAFGLPVHYLGKINDDRKLAEIYSAVDLMVISSREDNLPNTVLESIACGTPVVAFNVGGISDMIAHKMNGYLAAPLDTADLANGIEWILADEERYSKLSRQARIKAETTYSPEIIAKQYESLYQSLIKER